jgi:hypothetical protein
MPQNSIPQAGTPGGSTQATTLVSSGPITGVNFGLAQPSQPQGTTALGTQTTSRNPIAAQRTIYGTRGQLGGTITYVTVSKTTFVQQLLGVDDSDNGNIHLVITMAGHKITSFNGGEVTDKHGVTATVPLVIYFDGVRVPLTINGALAYGGTFGDWAGLAPTDGAYYVPADYFPPNLPNGSSDKAHDYRWRVRVEIDNGDPTNTSQPFPLLASDTITGNPGSWNSTCLQRGCAKAHVQLIWDTTRFNNGLPNITFDVSGKAVYDPRLSPPGFAYSENAALCLYDFLTDTKFGLSVDPSRVDQTLLIAAANVCDEAMTLREGGTQPRYACNGVVDGSMQRGQVVQKLLDAMAGTLIPPGNQWKIFAGAPVDSVLTITATDVRGAIKTDTAVSLKDRVNGAKGTFISPDNNWQSSDYPPYVNATYVVADGGTVTTVAGLNSYTGVVFSDLALDFVTDPVQAQRLAKIKVEKLRRKHALVLQCKMVAYPVEAHDTISFTYPRWGLTDATYEVTNTALVIDDKGNAPVLGYDLVCVPTDANVYAWDPDVDEGTTVLVTAPLLPDNTNVGAPTGVGSPPVLGLLSDATTTIVRADGIAHSQILVTWTPPTDAHVLNGGYIEIFIKKVSDPTTAFTLAGTAAGKDSSFYIATNITDGIDYDVQIQSLNAAGSHSDPLSGSVVCSGAASTISASGGSPGPVGIANNDFEASATLPPTSWTIKGSPTLAFEISSQQQGLRSLKITSSVTGEGVQTSQRYGVVPGDAYTGEQYKVGGFIKGNGVGHGAIKIRFYDATDTEVGTPVTADGGAPTPASWNFYSAVGAVPSTAVYARVSCENVTSGTSVLNEFDSIVLFRVSSLEDEIVNGPSRGAITAANSSYRPLTNPLTSQYDGISGSPPTGHCEIDIAAFTMRSAIGPTNVSLNSGTITGLLTATVYHVYYDDPTYAGGTVTFFANTTQAIALNATGRFYVGSILTPIAGGLPTVGNNDGGTGAQSGQLDLISPTLRTDNTTDPIQWYQANHEETDGDTSNFFDLVTEETIWLGGFPNIPRKWTSMKLKVHSTVVSVGPASAAFCDYSLDDGTTWTNIFNIENGAQVSSGAGAGANSGSGTAWTAPSNITAPDNYASLTGVTHGVTSQELQATTFGFALPAGATIEGITVNFDEQVTGTAPNNGEVGQFSVQLLKAGSPVGTPKTFAGGSIGTVSVGNNADLWGTTWAYGDINNGNFGFEVAAITPSQAGAWASGTFYSPLGMCIDSNGNFQIVVTPGTSGATHPTWSTTLSGTTSDGAGSLVWAVYQLASTWSAGQTWNPGDPTVAPNGVTSSGAINTPHFITATAGGVPCLFELTTGRMPRLGNMTVYIYPNGGTKGAFDKAYPIGNPPVAPIISTSVNSLHWWGPDSGAFTLSWYQINANGSVGTPFSLGEGQAWECIVVGQMFFPKAGTYNFNMAHDDGALIAFDSKKVTKLSGSAINDAWSAYSPSQGYPWMAGNNNSGQRLSEPLSIKVLADNSTVGFEIGFTNWEHQGQMIVTCQDSNGVYQEIVPVSTPAKTGTITPTWPAWSTAYNPSWPSVADSAGNFIWVNRGPIADCAWPASTPITAAGQVVADTIGDGQAPYRAGKSGASEPTNFAEITGRLTNDGSTLVWRNNGTTSAVTTFNFAVRNGNISVTYLPPGATTSRSATTDEITLPLTQNLALLQVRYGLTADPAVVATGEIQMGEVFVEAQAG